MSNTTLNQTQKLQTSQILDNTSFDDALGLYMDETAGSPDAVGGGNRRVFGQIVKSNRSSAAEELTFTTYVDKASSTVTYAGDAAPGTATSAAAWRIQKIDTSSGVIVTNAAGSEEMTNIWDNRASLSYS